LGPFLPFVLTMSRGVADAEREVVAGVGVVPSPSTLHPSPFTLKPTSFTPDPAPCTMHPAPCTLLPACPGKAYPVAFRAVRILNAMCFNLKFSGNEVYYTA